jgi:uncharacterized membrane protein
MSTTPSALIVTALWILFIATHVGLGALRRRMSERRFVVVFTLVADVLFALLVLAHGVLSRLGPWLYFHDPSYERAFAALAIVGLTLMVAGGIDYLRTPMVPLIDNAEATELQRLTRHPFMIGIALWGAARAALAAQPVDVAFFAGFALLALAGSWHQDRKLARRRGDAYRRYLSDHPAVPLLGMLRRRTLADGPWLLLVVSVPFGVLAHLGHGWLFGTFGIPFAALFIAGSGFFIAMALQRATSAPGQPPR